MHGFFGACIFQAFWGLLGPFLAKKSTPQPGLAILGQILACFLACFGQKVDAAAWFGNFWGQKLANFEFRFLRFLAKSRFWAIFGLQFLAKNACQSGFWVKIGVFCGFWPILTQNPDWQAFLGIFGVNFRRFLKFAGGYTWVFAKKPPKMGDFWVFPIFGGKIGRFLGVFCGFCTKSRRRSQFFGFFAPLNFGGRFLFMRALTSFQNRAPLNFGVDPVG